MPTCYLSLGSNLSDRERNLREAINLLKCEGIKIKKISSIYETTPIGYKNQPNFLNQVIEIKTEISPQSLLNLIKGIEKKMGRKKSEKWRERIIDIDIIIYGDLKIKEKDLVIPHKEFTKRKFVLVPLSEIAPDLICFNGKSIKELLCNFNKKQEVRLYN